MTTIKISQVTTHFGASIAEFNILVPSSYKHGSQIDTFGKTVKREKNTYYYNPDFTDKNFSGASNALQAGKVYKVRLFPVLKTVSSEDCLTFLAREQAILTGGQGLTLVHCLRKDIFPVDNFIVSFDVKDALWHDLEGSAKVPYINLAPDGEWRYNLGRFGYEWFAGNVLLCINVA